MYKCLSGRYWQGTLRQREREKSFSTGLCFLRASPSGSSCVQNRKSAPWIEALGQANRFLLQKDWMCVSVCSAVLCLVGSSQELGFQLLQSCGIQEHKPTWPLEPGDQGVSSGWKLQKAGYQMCIKAHL